VITGRDAYEEHAAARARWLGDTWLPLWHELPKDEQDRWEREADFINRKDMDDG